MIEHEPGDVDPRAVDRSVEWLMGGALPQRLPQYILQELCERLAAAGVSIERGMVYVATLHPNVLGRRFLWRRGQTDVAVDEAGLVLEQHPDFNNSPISKVMRDGRTLRARLEGPDRARDFPVYDEFHDQGITDYLAQPLAFINGEKHAATWATMRPGGFTRREISALKAVRTPLARVAEAYALRRLAATLLNTYVGHNAGARILSGQIRRGHTETIHAAIWLADLRGFTRLADTLPGPKLVALLNAYFDCLVGAAETHGGEVLKFMGDGLLAIFPTAPDIREDEVCGESMAAAREVRVRMAELNRQRAEAGEPVLQFGLALHVGDVLYGNIGGAARLDFTTIGPAVNLAARLEALAGRMGRTIVVSSAVARHCGDGLVPLGRHELRGFRAAEEVYGLADEQPAGRAA
jgi:adenylate cyclase